MKNEADIAEAHVRHHARYFNKIIVSDDGSTDGTYEILQNLVAVGLPVIVLREPHIGKDQSRFMTRLMRMGFDEFHADWVAPLDADEFFEPAPSASLRQLLPERSENPVRLPWSNFVWSADDDDSTELNPVIRLQRCMPPRHDMSKIFVPSAVGRVVDAKIGQGNHDISVQGRPLPAIECSGIRLCHYPIRSVAQYASKMAIGYLQYAALPGRLEEMGFQYNEPFSLLKSGIAEFAAKMEMQSRSYSFAGSDDIDDSPMLAPLHYVGGALEFTSNRDRFLPNVLNYAEALAAGVVARECEANAFDELLRAATPEIEAETARTRLIALTRRKAELERAHDQALSRVHTFALANLRLVESLDQATAREAAVNAELSRLQSALLEGRAHTARLNCALASTEAAYVEQTNRLESPEFLMRLLLEIFRKRLPQAVGIRRAR
jgi:hypothetical protein